MISYPEGFLHKESYDLGYSDIRDSILKITELYNKNAPVDKSALAKLLEPNPIHDKNLSYMWGRLDALIKFEGLIRQLRVS